MAAAVVPDSSQGNGQQALFTIIRAEFDDLRAIDLSKNIGSIVLGKYEDMYEACQCLLQLLRMHS